MLGFTLPLLVLAGIEGTIAMWLLLPLPVARPAIWICQRSQSQVGRTVMFTISAFLVVLCLAPIYDLISLHKMKYESKGSSIDTSEARETEATSNLSAILTLSGLVTMFVVQRLGLALGDIDARGGWSKASKIDYDATQKADALHKAE